ncbi:MAG: hypothetical protein H5T83_05785 [Actinotalea sp.]|nr:hypothetical protein [Actinotalea sp.]
MSAVVTGTAAGASSAPAETGSTAPALPAPARSAATSAATTSAAGRAADRTAVGPVARTDVVPTPRSPLPPVTSVGEIVQQAVALLAAAGAPALTAIDDDAPLAVVVDLAARKSGGRRTGPTAGADHTQGLPGAQGAAGGPEQDLER